MPTTCRNTRMAKQKRRGHVQEWIARRIFLLSTLVCATAGSASVSFRSPVNYTVGTNPTDVAVGDFNGDGKLDLAVANTGDPTVKDPGGISVLLGNGNGTFQSAINFLDGDGPFQLAVGDFDGDGNADLVVVRPGSLSGGSDKGDVTIFISNGDGTFRQGQSISTFTNPWRVVAADLNSDGILDVAILDLRNSVTVLLGSGNGSFQSHATYSVPANSSRIAELDFNHDGKKDLATSLSGNASIMLGNGDGTFQPAQSVGAFNTIPYQFPEFIADFNHDRNVDVIISKCVPFGSCLSAVLINNGDGTFSTPPGNNVFNQDTNRASDFDGDGNQDLAGTSSVNGNPQVSIFLGNGDGSFQQPASFSASNGFVALTTDLNGDKAPDIVIANSDGTISVILNSGTDFSLSATPLSPGSIGAGQSASSTLSLQLLNFFDNPVALSCSVQPSQAGAPTCSFDVNSVAFDSSGKATATLTISAGSLAQLKTGRLINLGTLMWFPIAGMALLRTGLSSRRRSRRTLLGIVPLAVLLGLISLQGCGGAGRGGPKQTNYAIRVTGASGQTTHSTTVNVTVQ